MERQSELLMWGCVAAILFAVVLAGVALRSPELDTTNNLLPVIRQPGLSNPVQAATPTPTETPNAVDDTTNTRNHIPDAGNEIKEKWSPCDQRHNATHLQAMGCYGGSSGGRSQAPVRPVPELPTGLLMAFGLLFGTIAQRGGGR